MSVKVVGRRALPALVLACLIGAVVPGAVPASALPTDRPPARAVARPAITKVITFVVENHSLAQMRDQMPYLHKLAATYAYADHYTAITHPSLPNYLALVSGSTHGVTDDKGPGAHPLSGATVLDQALDLGKTATVYVDSMRANCQLRNAGKYVVRHNPWAYFVDGRTSCRSHDVPVAQLATDAAAGTLPNLGLVVPNLVHDAHNASLGTADRWLKRQVKRIKAGEDWASGRLVIVITADEDDRRSQNTVLTVVASRYQVHRVVHTPLTHYSLTRLYGSVIGAPYLGNAADARSMRKAFGITTGTG